MTKGSRNRRSGRTNRIQAPALAGDAAEEEEKGQSGVDDVKLSPSNPVEMLNDSILAAISTKSPALASTNINILVQLPPDTPSGDSPTSSPDETSNNSSKPKNKTRHFTRSKKPRHIDEEVHLNGTTIQVSSKLPRARRRRSRCHPEGTSLGP
jgi:hypothetical protein